MVNPRATENTVTTFLRELLEKKGIDSTAFASIDTPDGRREVDILCKNGGTYVCEAKFSEKKLIEAIAKIQNDYLKHYKILGIRGGFAVLYPEELSKSIPIEVLKEALPKSKFKMVMVFLPDDPRRNFAVIEGTLEEIGGELAKQILTPPATIEPTINWVIRVLRESAEYITLGLRDLSGESLEDIFGGRDVFRNVLQYEANKYPVEDLRLASAYLLINQLLFYHILSRRKGLDEIDPDGIKSPSDLMTYFRKVLDINYEVIFSYDVASKIPPKYVQNVRDIISVVKSVSPEKIGGDLLGTIFHDLIPFEVRKAVAAFYTNVTAAEMLAWLAIDNPDDSVVDFSVGSGGLLVAAYRRKRDLISQRRDFTQEDHSRFVESELLGVDVMPFAATIAASHLALQSPEFLTNKLNIAIWDSTELLPNQKIPSIASLKHILRGQSEIEMFDQDLALPDSENVKGAIKISKGAHYGIELRSHYDVVIMNPPFTRQERLPNVYKKRLTDRFRDYEKYLHGQLGLHGYFILLADRFVSEGGRIAFVLPATVLKIKSFEAIRKLLADNYHVEHIVTSWYRSAFSESTMFREILLVAKRGQPVLNARTKVTVLKKLPEKLNEARKIAELIRRIEEDYQDDLMNVKLFDYARFRKDTKNWFKWVSVRELSLLESMEDLLSSGKLVPLSSVAEAEECDLRHFKFGDFHGFILNGKSRAKKKTDLWALDRVANNKCIAKHVVLGSSVDIPRMALGRGLRRLSYVDTMDVTDTADYLIISWFDKIKELAEAAMTKKNLERFDSRVVEKWKNKFVSKKSHVLLGRRFDISAPGTSFIAFYSENPLVGIDFWSIRNGELDYGKILTLWLNSTLNILQTIILRTETRGAWMKIHDYMLDEFLVPKYDKISDDECALLVNIFERVKNKKLPSILEQLENKHPVRRLIDEAWLRVLGYKGNASKLLDKLYEALVEEVVTLREMMAEGD